MADTIGVAMLGYAFMGKAHSRAFREAAYLSPALVPRLVSISGRTPEKVEEARRLNGWEEATTDWREQVQDDRVQLFDNGGPNDLHAEPTIEAARNGKHILCEKPLGRTADEARAIWSAAEEAGVVHMCGFNYRFVPAVRLARADFAGSLGAHFIIWPGIEGYNYPFQTPYPESWKWLVEGIGEAAERCREHGVSLFLEHKNSEPAMKIFMRNIGMTLHVIHKLRVEGIDNVKVNMDWQHHLIMNGENLAEYAAMLAAEGLLGHQHANSGWGTFDDDNMVGATAFMETLELAVELRRAGYGENGERLGFDLYPYTEDQVAAVRRSVLQWNFIDSAAARIDDASLREAQREKDAVRAYELVYAALGAE